MTKKLKNYWKKKDDDTGKSGIEFFADILYESFALKGEFTILESQNYEFLKKFINEVNDLLELNKNTDTNYKEKLFISSLFIENELNKFLFTEFPKNKYDIKNLFNKWLNDMFINSDDKDIYESIKKMKENDNITNPSIEDLKKENSEFYWDSKKYQLYLNNLSYRMVIIFDLMVIIEQPINRSKIHDVLWGLSNNFTLTREDAELARKEAIEKYKNLQ